MRRKDNERDAAFAWQVMAEAPYATLSLVDGESRPYAVPVSQAAWPEGEVHLLPLRHRGKEV